MEEQYMRLETDELWQKHLELLNERSRTHSYSVSELSKNSDYNRYFNVKPYDRTRVKLSRTADRTDYINANLVTVPKAARQYILTQGPLYKTLGHFWLMIWEQKSNVIVMLNRCFEMERNKCEQYWPDDVDEVEEFRDTHLKVTLKKVINRKHYTVRELLLYDNDTEKSRTITQFHYTAWPDHGQPDSPTSFLRLLTAVRKSGGLDKMDEPTIVHCSAGIGRSGTFCLIDSVLNMIESQGSTEGVDIDSMLIDMRDCRMGLIQSATQLRFAYMSILYGVKILERANKLHPHISSINDPAAHKQQQEKQEQNNQKQTSNGSSQTNGNKKNRRNKKKQTAGASSSSSTLNIFKKQLLVEALDDVDSDTADRLFYDTMKPWPSIKKPRNSSPDDFNGDYMAKLGPSLNGSDPSSTSKAEMLTNAINSLLTENTISTNNNVLNANASTNQNVDSVLLRRRERELQNQRLAEKTQEIKKKMKAEELKHEQYLRRMSLFKRSAVMGSVAALVVSSVIYLYLN